MKRLKNNKNLKEVRQKLRKGQTAQESLHWSKLRKNQLGVKFFRQYSIGNYIVDFYCPARRLAVELDGSQHGESEEQGQKDERRNKFLRGKGIKVLRFWNDALVNNLEGVLDAILFKVEA